MKTTVSFLQELEFKNKTMHYEINIALNGKHLFTTSERSLQSEDRFKQCFALLKEKFPESEGYSVTATHWKCVGQSVEG